MTYPNAHDGVKKVFVAEILMIITAIGGIAVQIMTADAMQS